MYFLSPFVTKYESTYISHTARLMYSDERYFFVVSFTVTLISLFTISDGAVNGISNILLSVDESVTFDVVYLPRSVPS